MKQQILSEISSKLSAIGISMQNGNGADITINTEFLDTEWSTGSKKIIYEASIYVNEQDNVVYMYEKTTEIGQGLSFGSNSSSSFQSGTTLFRKVKSVQYGFDGKAYEYTLDLGAIPKGVKEAAKQYGWKFKIVLNKNKAMYPDGYVTASSPQIMEHSQQNQQQSQYNNRKDNNLHGGFDGEAKATGSKSKVRILGLIGFILLGVITALIFMLMSVSLIGWGIGAINLMAFGFWQRKITRNGCFLSIILWIVTAVILLFVLTFTSPSVDKKGSVDKSFSLNDGKCIEKFKLSVSHGVECYLREGVIC